MIARRIPREEMDRRHRAAAPPVARDTAPRPAVRNFGAVLDLGNTTYLVFRGRPFGVPPVPYKLGQTILLLWLQAISQGKTLTEANAPAYYAILRQLPPLLWRHMRVVGRTRRLLRWLGLLRNPLVEASEAELMELAAFFLQRRMQSGVQFPPALASPGPKTA